MGTPAQELRTFFVTSVTVDRKNLLQSERMALLLLDVLHEPAKGPLLRARIRDHAGPFSFADHSCRKCFAGKGGSIRQRRIFIPCRERARDAV